MSRTFTVIASCFFATLSTNGYSFGDGSTISRGPQPVLLAQQYQSGFDLRQYWKSEKLDGIRAVWDGQQLKTRNGRVISAPQWFTDPLPKSPLDGELWAGRRNFHLVQQTVLDHKPVDQAWKQIEFMLFDMPDGAGSYKERYGDLVAWVNQLKSDHVHYVEHTPILSEHALYEHLNAIDRASGEGVMLRKIDSLYQAGRSADLLKLKSHQDDEAIVVGYKLGKGKYKGQVGALLVEWKPGVRFYIGSGLSDEMRRSPPPLGSKITFRHNGYTHNHIPKFARYFRERVE